MNDETTVFGVTVNGEEQNVTLADLAGLDLSGVEEFRFGPTTPAGVFEWKIAGNEFGITSWTDKKTGEDVTASVIDFNLVALACRACKNPDIDPADLTGIEHRERFFIRDVLQDLGRVKAFLVDIGMTGQGTVQDLLDQCVGREFIAPIKHRKNPNDADRPYANIDLTAIAPLVGAEMPQSTDTAGAPASGVMTAGGAAKATTATGIKL